MEVKHKQNERGGEKRGHVAEKTRRDGEARRKDVQRRCQEGLEHDIHEHTVAALKYALSIRWKVVWS